MLSNMTSYANRSTLNIIMWPQSQYWDMIYQRGRWSKISYHSTIQITLKS